MMIKHLVLAAGAVLLLGMTAPEQAQAQTTECRQTFPGAPEHGMTCTTKQPLFPRTPAAPPAPAAPVVIDPTLDTTDCPRMTRLMNPPLCQENARNKRLRKRKEIGEMIVGGRCTDAFAAAIREGDFEFAKEVKVLCATN